MFARENGPFDLFMSIRKFIYLRTVYNPSSKIFSTLNNGIVCIWCNSIWFAFISSIFVAHDVGEWMLYTLAISTLVIVVQVIIEWLQVVNEWLERR
jgi:hypothetical protein